MYQVWYSYYGEFLALGIWGILLALVRRVLFGKLCKEAALGNGGKGKMLKAMTLKFEKSYELNVGVYDRAAFVGKYLCQEKSLASPGAVEASAGTVDCPDFVHRFCRNSCFVGTWI